MPSMSSVPLSARFGRLRTRLTALTTCALVLGTAAAVSAAPASADKPTSAPVRALCSAPERPGYARCFALARTDIAKRPLGVQPHTTPSGFGPTDLQDAYSLPSNAAGSGQTVAIVDAFDNPDAESDLAVYRQQYGLAPCTTANGCFRKVNQDGDAGPYPAPNGDWAGEIALDVDMVSAACPNCHILLVETDDNYTDNLAAGVDTAVSLGAKYVSNSYGGAEDPSQTDFDDDYNHPGVAVTASTGDYGYGAQYPATAPGVTAVGGTSLVQDSSTRGWSESTWSGTGSGCSQYTPKPSFQHDPDCAKRTEADVSAVADPATGVAVYNSYSGPGWDVYGGTSASSPLIASTYALAGQPVAGTNPQSYPYQAVGSLHDVTTGSNGSCDGSYLCTAGPGYDGPTGLGTPNGVSAFRTGPHGTLAGTVTNAATHKAISGATVTAGQNSATTSATGKYTMSVPTGTYTVKASAYGYAQKSVPGVVVSKGMTTMRNFALAAVPSETVSGNVLDASGHGWPLYASMTINGVPGGPVYSNPFTGAYRVSLPSNHTYTATVDPVYPGYESKQVTFEVGTSDLNKDIGMQVDASACDAPGYATKYNGLVEHFDSTTKPAGWQVTDRNGSGQTWVFDDPGARGNLTGGTGNFAIIDSDHDGTGNTQDTSLITPSVDLSNQAAPVLGLNSDYKEYSNSTATISYSVDGGTKWTTLWTQTTDSQQGPLQFDLPAAAHKSDVRVKFHYTGEFAYYWEVDDVFVGTRACKPVPGGLVSGFVRDQNTGAAVNGATVQRVGQPAETATSTATPDDPNIPDGFYWLFTKGSGTQQFRASKSNYASVTAAVPVTADAVTRHDFDLAAGRLTVSPGEIERTAVLGQSAHATVTLRNTGTRPVQVDVGEQAGTFQIAGQPARSSYAGVQGAPVHNVAGHYSPLRMTHASGKPAPAAVVPADAPWQDVTDLPDEIQDNSGSSDGTDVYSVGGTNNSSEILAALYKYDPTTLEWTQLADMTNAREAPVSAWMGGKLYVAGGWGSDGDPVAPAEVYDPASDSWTTLADNPNPYGASGAAVLDGKLYVVGGCDTACGTSDVEVYDPAADAWSDGPAYPESTSWIACGTIGDTMYCAGGTNDSSSSTSTYSFDGSTWTKLADMPEDDWAAATSVANGQLLVSGGAIENSSVLTNEGWSYDPASDSWTALPNSNNSYYRLAGACGFYKIGGSVGNFVAESGVEELPGYDQCSSGAADVTWLSESPKSLTIAPGATKQVSVQLNSARLAQPGTYTAALTFGSDAPYKVDPVDVTFDVTPPATWGKVYGTVSGKGCDGTVAPLAGATVEIDGYGGNHTLTTGQDGTYALWLDERSNPLTVIAAKDGWAPQTRKSTVKPGTPKRENFTLRPSKSCS